MLKKYFFPIIIILTSVLFGSCIKDLDQLGYFEETTYKGVVAENGTCEPLANIRVYTTDGVTIVNETKTRQDGSFEIPISVRNLKKDFFLVVCSQSMLQEQWLNVCDYNIGLESQRVDTIFFFPANIPYVVTVGVTDIDTSSANCTGRIESHGFAAIESRGFVLDTIEYPTLANHIVESSELLNLYHATISFDPDKKYYVRAYAKNKVGVGYGEPIEFRSGTILPSVTTSEVSEVTAISANCGGKVTSTNGYKVISYGLCWSLTPVPTLNNQHAEVGYGEGEFSMTISNLLPGRQYYVRAYAQNENGVAYGNQEIFTTQSGLPVVATGEIISQSSDLVEIDGIVSSDGGFQVISRGICFGVGSDPTINGTHTNDGAGIGTFVSQLTGLTPGTTYYYRAYATNGVGTSYGELKSFVAQ